MRRAQARAARPPAARARRDRTRMLQLGVICTLAIVLVLEIVGVAANAYYQNRAMPNTQVAGQSVGGLTKSQIEEAVAKQSPPSSISLTYRGVSVPLDVSAVRLALDADSTASRAIDGGRGANALDNLLKLGATRSEQVVAADEGALQTYLNRAFADVLAGPTEPTITFDKKTEQFTFTPGKDGERIDASAVVAALSARWRSGEPLNVKVVPIEAQPAVPNAAAEQAMADANAMLEPDLTLKVGATTISIDKAARASFISVGRAKDGTLTVRPNTKTITSYVTGTLRPRIETTGAQTVIVRGGLRGGDLTIPGEPRLLLDVKGATKAISAALVKRPGGDVAIPASQQAPSVRTVADGTRSVDIDLSKQTMSLRIGGQTLRTYVISSGKARTPTIQGTFRVWHKTVLQDMSGGEGADAYYLKDVRWNTFFSGNYAFHTANWHDDFGKPVSHGCVNMREQDAKASYEFAPLGTLVTVHE